VLLVQDPVQATSERAAEAAAPPITAAMRTAAPKAQEGQQGAEMEEAQVRLLDRPAVEEEQEETEIHLVIQAQEVRAVQHHTNLLPPLPQTISQNYT
jgi:hypothetical protein